MTSVAAIPAVALLTGAAVGVYTSLPLAAFVVCAVLGWLALTAAVWHGSLGDGWRPPAATTVAGPAGARLIVVSAAIGFFGAGAALAAQATREALAPPLLEQTRASRPDVVGVTGAQPVILTGRIQSDAVPTEFGAAFTFDAETLESPIAGPGSGPSAAPGPGAGTSIAASGIEPPVVATSGTVRISVGGSFASRARGQWRAGRRVRVVASLSAPLPYRNIGIPDHETRLALAGIRLFGSVKSAAQVELLARGRWWEEAAAGIRAHVRTTLARHVGASGGDRALAGQSAAIATAILIGDRAGLDVDVEERLQRAGTFHVIAISGGNIAILTAVVLGLLRLSGAPPRTSAVLTLIAIALYALIVGTGASVARAALAAIVYLLARALDHATPSLNLLAVVVGLVLAWAPLSIVDPGFWLTCLATLAILTLANDISDRITRLMTRVTPWLTARRTAREPDASARVTRRTPGRSANGGVRPALRTSRRRIASAVSSLFAATVAAEIVLLPVSAYAFSQVTVAGLLLNFIAIPCMTILQIAGLVTVISAACCEPLAQLAGFVVHLSARAIVDSAALTDVTPWSAMRVPPPPVWLVLAAQACFALAWFGRPHTWLHRTAAIAWAAVVLLIVCAPVLPSFTLEPLGVPSCRLPPLPSARAPTLRVTVLDVGQGDAVLVRFPGDDDDDRAWLVDAGGALGRFDVGTRVVSPALWALGVRRLSTLVLTHGDRDHIGGAPAVLRDFTPDEVWEGVPVEGHADLARLKEDAARRALRWRSVHATALVSSPSADVRIWHPPTPSAPGWTRARVRNDDSIVLEIASGGVSLLLPGDIGSVVERSLAPALAAREPQPSLRLLKVPHHGSRTSSSLPLLDAFDPHVALVSAGRGNRHGHPSSSVLARYDARGTAVFRTDRDGAIQIDTDGRALAVRTCSGRVMHLIDDG